MIVVFVVVVGLIGWLVVMAKKLFDNDDARV